MPFIGNLNAIGARRRGVSEDLNQKWSDLAAPLIADGNTLTELIYDKSITIDDEYGHVGSWADIVNGILSYDAASEENRPIVSQCGIAFDGSDDSLHPTNFVNNQPITLYIVVKHDDYATGPAFKTIIGGSYAKRVALEYKENKMSAYAGNQSEYNSESINDNFGIVIVRFDGINSFLRVNDNSITFDCGEYGTNGMTIANEAYSSFSTPGKIKLKHVILRNNSDDSDTVQTIKNYLYYRYIHRSKFAPGVCISFDDPYYEGVSALDNWVQANTVLKGYGWKATYGLMTQTANTTEQQDIDELLSYKDRLLDLVADGHEIANHGLRHPYLPTNGPLTDAGRVNYYNTYVKPLNDLVSELYDYDMVSAIYSNFYGVDCKMSALLQAKNFYSVRQNTANLPVVMAAPRRVCYDGTDGVVLGLDVAPYNESYLLSLEDVTTLLDYAYENNLVLNLFGHRIACNGETGKIYWDIANWEAVCQYVVSHGMKFYTCSELRPSIFGLTTGDTTANWIDYWETLISATIESDNPNRIVLLFPESRIGLTDVDFTVTVNGSDVNIVSGYVIGTTVVLNLAENCVEGDAVVVTFIKTGGTVNVTMIIWADYWETLISATIEPGFPSNVVLTFPVAHHSLGTSDFTIAGFTIISASWAGSVLTLSLDNVCKYGDEIVVTFVKTEGTANVVNNLLPEAEMAVYTNGLTTPLSSAQYKRLNDLVVDIKLSLGINNLSDRCDYIRIIAGETEESSYKNIVKNNHHATNVNAMAWLKDEGVTGDGSGKYLNSNYKPKSQAEAASINSFTLFVYVRTNQNLAQTEIGSRKGSSDDRTFINVRTNSGGHDGVYYYINTDITSGGLTLGISDGRGLTMVSRTADNLTTVYKNGVSIANVTHISSDLPDYEVFEGALNSAGSAINLSQNQIAITGVIDSVNETEALSLAIAFENYMDSLGKGVITF